MNPFKLEEYLGEHEFKAPYLLCCSDAQSFSMKEIIAGALPEHARLWNDLSLGYIQAKGMPALRLSIRDSFYPDLSPENILCFAGAQDGIFCALYTLCAPGDHVVVITPCYQSLMEIPLMRGCEISALPLREENGWKLCLSDLKAALTPRTKVIVMNFPHNPTGQVITQEELQELVDLCAKRDIWLFSDEVYRLLGAPKEPWAAPAANLYPKALSLGVMSKAYGLAGLRVGWIACQDTALLQEIERTKHYTSICNGAPCEVLSLMALGQGAQILERNNAIVGNNLATLDTFLNEKADLFSWVKPQGGCVGLVRYKGKENVDAFCARLLSQKGVLLMPSSLYDMPGQHFRIGFGRLDMEEGLGHLRDFLA